MRCLALLIVAIACGCDRRTPAPISAKQSVESLLAEIKKVARPEPLPIRSDVISIKLGASREVIAPPGSATAGSKWIETDVTFTNKSYRSVWIYGQAANMPFFGIDVRQAVGEPWKEYGTGYCGFGAKYFEIAPGTTYSFNASLPEKDASQEFRVFLPYRTIKNDEEKVRAVSAARQVAPPATE